MENGARVETLKEYIGGGLQPDEGDVGKACKALSEQLWGGY